MCGGEGIVESNVLIMSDTELIERCRDVGQSLTELIPDLLLNAFYIVTTVNASVSACCPDLNIRCVTTILKAVYQANIFIDGVSTDKTRAQTFLLCAMH